MPTKARDFTLEELLIARMAKEHRKETMAAGATICSAMAVKLAKATHAPDLMEYSWTGTFDTRAVATITLNAFIGAKTGKGRLTWNEVFDYVIGGKYEIWIGPVQVDQYGNSNIWLVGDWKQPSAVLIGARGAPDDSVSLHSMLYHVVNHSVRTFVPRVDYVCGVGYTREREKLALKLGEPELVVSNLGVFDFDPELKRMRLQSVHPGVTVAQVRENTGFELVIPERVPETEPPTEEEVQLIRTEIDPLGIRRLQHAGGAEAGAIRKEILAREREFLQLYPG